MLCPGSTCLLYRAVGGRVHLLLSGGVICTVTEWWVAVTTVSATVNPEGIRPSGILPDWELDQEDSFKTFLLGAETRNGNKGSSAKPTRALQNIPSTLIRARSHGTIYYIWYNTLTPKP